MILNAAIRSNLVARLPVLVKGFYRAEMVKYNFQ